MEAICQADHWGIVVAGEVTVANDTDVNVKKAANPLSDGLHFAPCIVTTCPALLKEACYLTAYPSMRMRSLTSMRWGDVYRPVR